MRGAQRAVLFVLLLSACAPVPATTATPRPTAARLTPGRLITREQAIAGALARAAASAPEVSGALVTPSNVQAQQITLGEAMQRMWGNADPPRGYTPDMPVWYVTMDGLWKGEMPAPGVTVMPAQYHHYIIVLDAVTGLELEASLRP